MNILEFGLAFLILGFWTLFPLGIFFSTKDLSPGDRPIVRIKGFNTRPRH